jgi:hypothetical protein
MPENAYIVFNDINLSTAYGGGREYFDKMLNLLDVGVHDRGHFHNDNKQNTYGYGREFPENTLIFPMASMQEYNPFGSCSSAQMIYKKVGVNT